MRTWTENEDQILRKMYPNTDTKVVAKFLRKSVGSVYNRTYILGLKKDKEFLSETARENLAKYGAKTRFKKGQTPTNKGKKQAEFMSPEAIERSKKTRFKKGDMPVNFRPVGSERINKDGYTEIKVKNPRTWRLKHRVIWEKANGKIPKDHNVQFKDGNSRNIQLDNLYLISKKKQMIVNSIHNYPPHFHKVMRKLGKLKKTIKKLEKQNEKE